MNRLTIILLSKEESTLADVASVLSAHQGFDISCFKSAQQAWSYLQDNKIDVVVADDLLQDSTGLEFIKELVPRNPFVNCALISPLSHDEFHEVTEGYGIFMQLPVEPTAQLAYEMIDHLDKIYKLTS